MDFKSLINKLDSMEAPPQTPAAPELPKSVQLDEDIAMHVLAGTKTLTEAADLMEKKLTAAEKEKKEEVVKSMKKDKEGFEKRYGDRGEEVMHATATKIAKKKAESIETTDEEISEVFDADDPVGAKKQTQHGTATKTATGMKHERGAPASSDDEEDDDAPKSKKKKKNESIDPEEFKSKFLQMVEAAKKGDKKVKGKKAEEKMDEAKKPDEDNDRVPDWADKKPGEDDNAGKKKSGKKEMSAKQAKYFGKKNESVKTSKKVVAESIEMPLTFKDMVKLVQESGGQQQIDALDKELFAWATRMAKAKLGEGMKAEVYAGLVYERMGGRFEMYDVLSETRMGSYEYPEGERPKTDEVMRVLFKSGFSEEDVFGLLRFATSSGNQRDAGPNFRKMLKTLSAKGIDLFDIENA